jgi:tight adherence protein B
MNLNLGSNSFLAMVVLVFVAVLLLVEGSFALWRTHKGPQAKRFKKRLQALAATSDRSAQTRLLKERLLNESSAAERFLLRLPRMRMLDRSIMQSGLNWTVYGLLLTSIVLFVVAWLLATDPLHLQLALKALVAVAAAALPLAYVLRKRHNRLARLESQLPDVLDLITRALRAGHAFTAALKMAGDEMAEPSAGEFRIVHDEINFGVSLQQALTHLSERVPSTDLRYFVVAVLIQRESGGNLTEILMNLSQLIRNRAKFMAKVRVLSSEGKLSAWILGIMPFVLAGLMNLVNPKFMSLLWTDPIGITMIQYMLVLMAVGALIMRKIVRIRV